MPGKFRTAAGGLAAAALATVVVAAAPAQGQAASAPATAQASARTAPVVLSPRPGQRVVRQTVQLAVRAGAEHGDLSARLNGAALGEEFARTRPGLRTLRVNGSHGLRHGRNVLRVVARTGTTVRRATIRFTVGHRKPLVGAGRRTHAVAGRATRLAGRVVHHPRGARARGVRWTVVSSPRGSRHRRGRAAGRTLTPLFRPDVAGSYVLRMHAGSGDAAAAATVAVEAGPRTAALEIDTAVDGADPAGARSSGTIDGRPGIRVGEVVYRAEWLRSDGDARGNANGSFSGRAGNTDYRATWQIVVLDRTTLGFVWNRTYGRCTDGGTGLRDYACRKGDNGQPFHVDLGAELAQVDGDHLVIAASHPSGGAGRVWAPPAETTGPSSALTRVGLPADPGDGKPRLLAGVPAGGAALIGTGGLRAGEAKIDLAVGGGAARLRGFLIADVNSHYGYVSDRREPFDTRSQASCDSGRCSYAMQLGGVRTSTAPAAADMSGYVIAVHDERTLARRDALIVGADRDASGMAGRIETFIRDNSRPGNLFAVSSFGPAFFPGRQLEQGVSRAMVAAIASIGGTRDGFNRAASTAGSGYTLLGWSGAGEGNGVEQVGPNARLRGVLAPDHRSRLRPANASADGAPAERLQSLLLAPRTTAWPLDGQPGPTAALTWIGHQVNQLGGDPRQAYRRQSTAAIAAAEDAVGRLQAPAQGQGFTPADFATAKRQLLDELAWVKATRDYLDLLAKPSGDAGKTVWEEATILQNRLEAELRVADEKGEVNAMWFGIIRSLLSLAGGLGELAEAGHTFAALIEVAAAATEAGETGWESMHSGAEEVEENPRVRADQLALTLERQAQQTVDSFWRMGNAIVSDPRKLREVGTNAACLPNGGCAAGMEEYAVTPAATAQATRAARAALEKTLYEQLVPLSFGVWDTGVSREPDPAKNFYCVGGSSLNSPFAGAPELARASALEELATPFGNEGEYLTGAPRWRTSILVHRAETSYSWPSEEVLRRMFEPLDPDREEGGLGIAPAALMRTAESRFTPGATCWWGLPGTDGVVERQP